MNLRQGISRLALLTGMGVAVLAGIGPAFVAPAMAQYSQSRAYFSQEQIDQLVAPVALYPDPLLAQILSAASYPEEIEDAQRFLRRYGDSAAFERQNWDYSVQALARYPEVLEQLADDLSWTEALGIAHVNQPEAVADSIQRWRMQAYDLGNLRTGSEQLVYVDGGYVRIVPTDDEYLYLPRYDPRVIYVERYYPGAGLGFLAFGPRYGIGPWLDKDWDWRRKRIAYSDRDQWRSGRPKFYPQFDQVHIDRNRTWRPDDRRFRPDREPAYPERFASKPVPPPKMRPVERYEPPSARSERAGAPAVVKPGTPGRPPTTTNPASAKPAGRPGQQKETPPHQRFNQPAEKSSPKPAVKPQAPAKASPTERRSQQQPAQKPAATERRQQPQQAQKPAAKPAPKPQQAPVEEQQRGGPRRN